MNNRVIDENTVKMSFDSSEFESGVKKTLNILDKLKQSLTFDNAKNSFSGLDETVKNNHFSELGTAVEQIGHRFSNLGIVGITALQNITNKAVNAGTRILKALTIDPVQTGFQEYELKMGSVQTIMAGTGADLNTVNKYLQELNLYADKTIYSFSDMTSNIGKFTNAGVKLEDAVLAIKGVSNEAAISGANANEASRAMYNFAQALSAGYVKLIDWKSIENANMATKSFKNELLKTAAEAGTVKKQADGMYKVLATNNKGKTMDGVISSTKNFNDSLSYQWMTTEVLIKTLRKYADENSKLGKKAYAAAQDIKTFTQLYDTLKEAAQSGWSSTWELIIGDFEEAKVTLTQISNKISGILDKSSNARNAVLSDALESGWKQVLGKGIVDEKGFIKTIRNVAKEHNVSVDKMGKKEKDFVKNLKNGWMTSDILSESIKKYVKNVENMSDKQRKAAGYDKERLKQIKELNDGIKNGSINIDEYVKKINRKSGRELIWDTLLISFDKLMKVANIVKGELQSIFPSVTGKQLYSILDKIHSFVENLKLTDDQTKNLKKTFHGLFSAVHFVVRAFETIIKATKPVRDSLGDIVSGFLNFTGKIGDIFTNLDKNVDFSGLESFATSIYKVITNIFNGIFGKNGGEGKKFEGVGNWFVDMLDRVFKGLASVLDWAAENVTFGDILKAFTAGAFIEYLSSASLFVKQLRGFIDDLGNKVKGDSIKENLKNVLDSAAETLKSFTATVKTGQLVLIAGSLVLLVTALEKIAQLKPEQMVVAGAAIGVLMAYLMKSVKSISKMLKGSGTSMKDLIGISIVMVAMSIAINKFADAMVKLKDVNLRKIGRGLTGLGGGLLELIGSIKLLTKKPGETTGLIKTGIAMVLIAKSCEYLANALQKFSGLSWDEIGRGLSAMGGALAELVASVSVLGKTGGFSSLLGSASIVLVIEFLDELAEGLSQFTYLSWDEIGRGLSAMGGALGEIGVVLGALGKIAGLSSLLASISIAVVINGLDELANALIKFGSMTWDQIGRGLVAMGSALGEVAVITGALGMIAGLSGLLGAASLKITISSLDELVSAFERFGKMSWSEIGRGLVAMGGALTEVGVITGALGMIAGLSGILGGAALKLTISSLDELVTAFEKFGKMSWAEIGRGLVAMGGALAEVAAISGVLGTLAGLSGLLGGASLKLTISGLDELAEALKKFSEMSWDEIGRGLAAMGSALSEVAIGGIINTFSGLGAASISKMAEPLGTLADSVKKWTTVTVPKGLPEDLSKIADGVMAFTFGGLGSGAISKVAEPLGILADSVKKWTTVIVPKGLSEDLNSVANAVNQFIGGSWGSGAIAKVVEPLGNLADSVKKWDGVTIPKTLKEDLTTLADGVKSFTWAFMSGLSIDTLTDPLKKLGEAVQSWNNVNVPKTLADDLSKLGPAIGSFANSLFAGPALDSVVPSFTKLADAISTISSAKLSKSFLKDFNALGETTKNFMSNVNGVFSVDVSKLSGLGNGIKTLSDSISSLKKTDEEIINNFISSVKKLTNFKIDTKTLNDSIKSLLTQMNDTIKKNTGNTQSAFKKLFDSANSACRTFYNTFKSTGNYVAGGLIQGLKDKESAAYNAGYQLGKKSAQGTKDGAKVNSPSKLTIPVGESIGEGLIIGMTRVTKMVTSNGFKLGYQAAVSTSEAIDKAQPTITPVLDLSDVRKKAGLINEALPSDYKINASLGSINTLMAQRQARSGNGTTQVVNAINGLKKGLEDKPTTVYNVGGVTYDDDSRISAAVNELISAIRVEGRV